MAPVSAAAPAPRPGYLLAIGELLVDAITTDFVVDLAEADTLRVVAGGSPANLCRFVQYAGGQARLVAAVGHDGLGRQLLRAVHAAGLDTTHIQQLDDHATSLIVVARSQGTPEFIQYRDADRQLQPVPPALLAGAAVVHTTAFALSKAPARHVILDAFAQAHAQRVPVSVDWNYAESVWGRKNNAAEVFAQVAGYEPLLKVSLDDVCRFQGAILSADDARAWLHCLPAQLICLTCGPDGVWFRGPAGTPWQHRPARPVHVVDATGAGDAFWAGFLTAWMQGHALPECAEQGLATAAQRLVGQL